VRGLAVARDVRREPQSRQDAAGHQPERQRPALLAGLQYRAEGVEVVAGGQRPAGGQAVQQVRVAVIHQVEDVEAIPYRCQDARVVEEPRRDPTDGAAGA